MAKGLPGFTFMEPSSVSKRAGLAFDSYRIPCEQHH